MQKWRYKKEVKKFMDINNGDIFLCGKHRLMCGDSLSLIEVNKLLDGQKADMIFTDPPYNINYKRENHNWKHNYKSKVDDFKDTGFNIKVLLNLINANILNGAFYICCGTNQIGAIYDWCIKKLKQEPRMLIWYKNNMSISRSEYNRRYEQLMYCWIGNKKWRGAKTDYNQDVWFIKNRSVSKYIHPTQKPIALIQKAIENSSDEEDIILDLFGGSGSTLMACENTNRRCYMMEINPKFVLTIIKRYEALTGNKAIKIDNTLIKQESSNQTAVMSQERQNV